MSRIAIFSDVHGNLPALKAVLKDIQDHQADQIYCLGDLVDFAPWPNEVIELIKSSGIPCLMGNHDERIAFDHDIIPLAKHSDMETLARIDAINHTKHTITAENRSYLKNLPRQLSISYSVNDQLFNILMVHASTRSNEEYIYQNHNQNDLLKMMDQHHSDILIMGHTHESYYRNIQPSLQKSKKTAINCGSVGRSKEGMPLATYLLLDVDYKEVKIKLIKLKYPVQETIDGITQSDIPNFYADFLNTQTHV